MKHYQKKGKKEKKEQRRKAKDKKNKKKANKWTRNKNIFTVNKNSLLLLLLCSSLGLHINNKKHIILLDSLFIHIDQFLYFAYSPFKCLCKEKKN